MSITKKDANQPLFLKLGLINCAAFVSESVTYPIDFIKTRVQSSTTRHGPIHTALQVIREEGVRTMYNGLPAAILRHWVYTAARIELYERFRQRVSDSKAGVDWGLFGKLLAGGAAGGIAQLIASPTDLVKVKLQTDRGKYRGVVHAAQVIYRTDGIKGFYKGWSPNVQRAVLVNLGELATYDVVKRSILTHTSLEDNAFCHALSSIGSGFFSSLCSCPADVVKTRMMKDNSQYKSTIDCFVTTARQEGVRALYKGFFPTWARLGPWQFIFWVTYEQGRKAAGMSGF